VPLLQLIARLLQKLAIPRRLSQKRVVPSSPVACLETSWDPVILLGLEPYRPPAVIVPEDETMPEPLRRALGTPAPRKLASGVRYVLTPGFAMHIDTPLRQDYCEVSDVDASEVEDEENEVEDEEDSTWSPERVALGRIREGVENVLWAEAPYRSAFEA
jgi:hypothetical protein